MIHRVSNGVPHGGSVELICKTGTTRAASLAMWSGAFHFLSGFCAFTNTNSLARHFNRNTEIRCLLIKWNTGDLTAVAYDLGVFFPCFLYRPQMYYRFQKRTASPLSGSRALKSIPRQNRRRKTSRGGLVTCFREELQHAVIITNILRTNSNSTKLHGTSKM